MEEAKRTKLGHHPRHSSHPGVTTIQFQAGGNARRAVEKAQALPAQRGDTRFGWTIEALSDASGSSIGVLLPPCLSSLSFLSLTTAKMSEKLAIIPRRRNNGSPSIFLASPSASDRERSRPRALPCLLPPASATDPVQKKKRKNKTPRGTPGDRGGIKIDFFFCNSREKERRQRD